MAWDTRRPRTILHSGRRLHHLARRTFPPFRRRGQNGAGVDLPAGAEPRSRFFFFFFFFRFVASPDVLQKYVEHQSSPLRELARGFAAGYNRYLRELRSAQTNAHRACRDEPWVAPIDEQDLYRRMYAAGLSPGVARHSSPLLRMPNHPPHFSQRHRSRDAHTTWRHSFLTPCRRAGRKALAAMASHWERRRRARVNRCCSAIRTGTGAGPTGFIRRICRSRARSMSAARRCSACRSS